MIVFDFIERHKFGILGTIFLHIVVFIYLNVEIIEYGVYQPHNKVVAVLDFSEDEVKDEVLEQVLDENGVPVEGELMNVTADANQDKTTYTNQQNSNSNFSKSTADQDVWNDLKQMEAAEYNRLKQDRDKQKSENTNDENTSKQQEVNPNLIKKEAENNENASHGMDTKAITSFSLKGRSALQEKKPSYLCRTIGKVRVTIKVNQKGEVISRIIDEKHTNTQNECLRTAALDYAKKWRFNQDFSDLLRKQGWIEFNYVAQ